MPPELTPRARHGAMVLLAPTMRVAPKHAQTLPCLTSLLRADHRAVPEPCPALRPLLQISEGIAQLRTAPGQDPRPVVLVNLASKRPPSVPVAVDPPPGWLLPRAVSGLSATGPRSPGAQPVVAAPGARRGPPPSGIVPGAIVSTHTTSGVPSPSSLVPSPVTEVAAPQGAAKQELLHRLESCAPPGADSEAIEKAIDRAHRKPRARAAHFKTDKLRAEAHLDAALDAIVPLIPRQCYENMLGGARGLAQVVGSRRDAQIRRRLRARPGTNGERVDRARLYLARVRKYASTELKLPAAEWDGACFPMSAGLANEIIHIAHVRATTNANGSQKGQCAAKAVYDETVAAAETLGWPIEVDKIGWQTSLPGGGRRNTRRKSKAGTLPVAAKCHFEHLARGNLPSSITGPARVACLFIVRSLLTAMLDQGVRIAEGVRVELDADEEDPTGVMRFIAYLAKDGAPIEVCAPSEGFTGAYDWWPEHVRDMADVGQVFPEWERPHGSRGSISMAGELLPYVARAEHLRGAFVEFLTMPPLSYTSEEVARMGIKGHSLHLSMAEWSRCIGTNPHIAGPDGATIALEGQLAHGFDDADADALANWLRDPNARQEATEAAAAAAAPAGQERRHAAIAALPGRGATRGAMRVYYGQGANRFGHRFKLLSARQRLARVVRAVLADRDWQALPRGQADMGILRSTLEGAA